jgi:hypothetical protein
MKTGETRAFIHARPGVFLIRQAEFREAQWLGRVDRINTELVFATARKAVPNTQILAYTREQGFLLSARQIADFDAGWVDLSTGTAYGH